MRGTPLGAWFADDLDTVAVPAAGSAVTTHAHPEATTGAEAIGAAVRGVPGDKCVATIAARVPDSEVASRLRHAATTALSADPQHVAGMLGCGHRISAVDTVPYAIWCAAGHLDDLPEALWATAQPGGDVDTTCAIVGGIIAGRTGLAGVPADWLTAYEPLPGRVDDISG